MPTNKYQQGRLKHMIEQQDNRCFWCHELIVFFTKEIIDTIPKDKKRLVRYIKVGGIVYRRATTDHIQPKKWGGSDFRYNVVASCFSCNNARETFQARRLRPKRWQK